MKHEKMPQENTITTHKKLKLKKHTKQYAILYFS